MLVSSSIVCSVVHVWETVVFRSALVAGYSVTHFLVNVPHETRTTAAPAADKSRQRDEDRRAVGLRAVLSCLRVVTDANLFDGRGRTPLMCAIVDGRTAAARQLVCFHCSFCSYMTLFPSFTLPFTERFLSKSAIWIRQMICMDEIHCMGDHALCGALFFDPAVVVKPS